MVENLLIVVLGDNIMAYRESNYQDTKVVDDVEINDLYRTLGIETEESRSQVLDRLNPRREYWPPIPHYSVRYCIDEDLNSQ